MIGGTVNSRYEVVIRFPIQDSIGQEHEIEALLDLGYSGSLSLPPPIIASLGLPWKFETVMVLADKSARKADVHEATIVWDSQPRLITVHSIDNVPLIGARLLVGHDLRARFQDGGGVEIEAIP